MNKHEFTEKCKRIAAESGDENILIPHIFKPVFDGIIPTPLEKEAGELYDFLDANGFFPPPKQEIVLGPTRMSEILLVESGSVDEDKLERDGFNIIVYRQGSKKPCFITKAED
jgi:hypothetical protein